ncbi:MAG: 2'-5' RNA ligase [Acidobacteria bacterium 13_1_40CM_4_69_4]|nr:MAG: 2'-5' RNA ligase [Acidobacteria bacterium 13_1_40CM_4_69_4]
MRLFVAAELPTGLREKFRTVQEALRQGPLPVRWVRPEDIHLTLKFLGDAPEARVGEITGALRPAGGGIVPFRLEACGAVPFPDRGAPRLVWVEVRGELEAARRLAAAIDAVTASVGFPPEAREFRAHLTLGRVKGPGRGDWRTMLDRVAGQATGSFDVHEYVLFQSRLGHGGAVHTPVQRFPLGGDGGAGRRSGDDR